MDRDAYQRGVDDGIDLDGVAGPGEECVALGQHPVDGAVQLDDGERRDRRAYGY